MNAALAAALALGALAAQDEPAPEAPAPAVELDFARYFSPRELAEALSALASAHPDLLSVQSIGKSRGGEDLWLVAAARASLVPPSERPAVLVVAGLGERDLFGTEAALRLLALLAEKEASGEASSRLLERAAIYVAPCANPDSRSRVLAELAGSPLGASAAREARADFDRNFPIGWDPIAHARSGGYPLCEPETRALAEFLTAHPNVAAVETIGWASAESGAGFGDAPALDVDAHREIAPSGGPFQPIVALAEPGGSWLAFAYGQAGAFAFARSLARNDPSRDLAGARELAALVEAAAPATIALAEALASLQIGAPAVEALSASAWKVDVAVANRGALPTASALARARGLAPAPRLEVSGARVLAAAARAAGGARSYEPIAVGAGGAVDLAEIGAGATLELRLVLASEAGAVLDLAVRAPRASGSTARIELR